MPELTPVLAGRQATYRANNREDHTRRTVPADVSETSALPPKQHSARYPTRVSLWAKAILIGWSDRGWSRNDANAPARDRDGSIGKRTQAVMLRFSVTNGRLEGAQPALRPAALPVFGSDEAKLTGCTFRPDALTGCCTDAPFDSATRSANGPVARRPSHHPARARKRLDAGADRQPPRTQHARSGTPHRPPGNQAGRR
jgi:hypothetical protein